MLVAVVGLTLAVLVGCGIGHGPYRNGYNGYHAFRSGDYYRSSGSHNASYDTAGRVNHRYMPDYGSGRGGYCGW